MVLGSAVAAGSIVHTGLTATCPLGDAKIAEEKATAAAAKKKERSEIQSKYEK